MPKPIRIVYVADAVLSNNSWWRGLGPAHELERDYPQDFQVFCPPQLDWAAWRKADVLWLGNMSNEGTVSLALEARSAGVKVLSDIDDLFWEIPKGNPSRKEFSTHRLTIMDSAVRMSDLVIVTTETLRDEIARRTGVKTIQVATNGWPDRLSWQPPQSRQPVVLWRGGHIHDHDISEVAFEIGAWLPDGWTFLACGSEPYNLVQALDGRYEMWGMMPIDYFHRRIAAVRPAILVSPLRDNTFNRCRSPIAYIEAAHAGAILVAPDFPQFQGLPAMTRYKNPRDIGEAMESARLMSESFNHVQTARDHIDQHMRTRNGNAARAAAIKALFA